MPDLTAFFFNVKRRKYNLISPLKSLLKRAEMKRPHLICLLSMTHRPAFLLLGFSAECLDSFIQGKIFLLTGPLGFCCFDLRTNVHSACTNCGCATALWVQPNPLTSSKDCLKKPCCWMLCATLLFCISMKCAPGPPF